MAAALQVEFTDEFGAWWDTPSEAEQESVDVSVRLLEAFGPSLGFPDSSGIVGSRHGHMRELRIQHKGRPLRVLYAFDPRRVAILLIGGDKTGSDRWYETFVPVADRLYELHLAQLRKEGLTDGYEVLRIAFAHVAAGSRAGRGTCVGQARGNAP